MALLKSIGSGNFTSTATWAVCTAVSESSASTANSVIFTATSYTYQNASTYSSTVTGNATGVLLKIGGRSSATGTVSVALADNAGNNLAECTMNVADIAGSTLPTGGSATIYGHWVFFKFNASVAITNGTFYRVGYKTSVVNALLINRASATTGVACAAIVTDTTQSPTAGDRFIVVGDNIASASTPGTTAGTKGSSVTVTMDNTVNTQFGDGQGTTVNVPYWSLYVGDNASLTYGTTVSTNYILSIRGNIGVGAGGDSYKGTLNIGTVATPMPRSSTARLEVDSAVAGNHGMYVQGGVLVGQGLSRTSGKDIDKCLLNADSTAGATALTVDTDTGWLSGDTVWIGPTARVAGTGGEERTLSIDASASTLTLTSGVTAARDGNSTIKAPLILTSRNVTVGSTSSTLQMYFYAIGTGTVVDCDWVKFAWIGITTSSKQGLYCDALAQNLTFDRCNFHGGYVSLFWTNSATGGAVVTNCTFTNIGTIAVYGIGAVSSNASITGLWISSSAGNGINVRDLNFAVNDVRISGCVLNGILFNAGTTLLTAPVTWSNIVIHSCATGIAGGINTDVDAFTLNNVEVQRCTATGVNFNAATYGVLFTGCKFWGNAFRNIYTGAANAGITFRDSYIASQSGNTTPSGVDTLVVSQGVIIFDNCQFGVGFTGAQTHTLNDVNFPNITGGVIILKNCVLASTNEVSSFTYDNTYVVSENHDQVAGAKKVWLKRGIISSDTTISNTGTRSLRLTPNASSYKLVYVFAKCAVASGSTPTIGVYVRKSVVGDGTVYNGSQPRLIVRRNIIVGLASDYVLATATNAANGAWELLSGTLPTLTGNGIIEIELDCDGTTGWVNIDDFQAPSPVNTKSFAIGDDTVGINAIGDNSSGGASPVTIGYAFVG